ERSALAAVAVRSQRWRMNELRRITSRRPKEIDRVRVARIADRQAGRGAAFQLAHLGAADSTVHGWVRCGYLIKVAPGVYAVGHVAPSREADLWAVVLYAGPGAALSHVTAAQWRGLADFHGPVVHV